MFVPTQLKGFKSITIQHFLNFFVESIIFVGPILIVALCAYKVVKYLRIKENNVTNVSLSI